MPRSEAVADKRSTDRAPLSAVAYPKASQKGVAFVKARCSLPRLLLPFRAGVIAQLALVHSGCGTARLFHFRIQELLSPRSIHILLGNQVCARIDICRHFLSFGRR